MARTGSSSSTAAEGVFAERIARLIDVLGDPWTGELTSYAAALAMRDEARKTRKARAPNAAFLARASALLHAEEIALSIITGSERRTDWEKQAHRALSLFAVESIRRGHVRSVAALKDIEVALLTEWHESSGPETAAFWRRVEAAGLPYVKRDILGEILQRGKITSREHYDFVTDSIVILEQEGTIDAAQATRLAQMLGAYEKRRS